METKLWYLKRCDLFENLSSEEAAALDRRALMRNFKRHSIIYSPTELGQSVMVLASGRVKIKDLTPDGKETILALIEEGEVFGELAVLDGENRQEYAEAISDCQILILRRDDLMALMEQRADVALSITKLIGRRRRQIENRLRNLLFLSSRDRMLRILAELIDSHGDWSHNSCEIRHALSHQELASLIGMTRETATATLSQLQSDGLIRVHRRRIAVLDADRLYEEAFGVTHAARMAAPRNGAYHPIEG